MIKRSRGHAKDWGAGLYVAPPDELARVAVEVGRKIWTRPKRDGQQRKPFRKEVPRELLSEWRKAWRLPGGNHQ